jgi:hypothetical protein
MNALKLRPYIWIWKVYGHESGLFFFRGGPSASGHP